MPKNEQTARRVLDLFLSEKDQAAADAFAALDPLTAAAVAIRVCYELDAPETAEFLQLLEDFEILPPDRQAGRRKQGRE